MALTAQELGERRIKKGDEIITVACGFPTTVTPAIQYGAVPVFVDVTIPQYNIDAVSYTHLDVYKRQHLHGRFRRTLSKFRSFGIAVSLASWKRIIPPF